MTATRLLKLLMVVARYFIGMAEKELKEVGQGESVKRGQ